MITAELANDYSRDVFAFPGDIDRQTSQVCNLLIKKHSKKLIFIKLKGRNFDFCFKQQISKDNARTTILHTCTHIYGNIHT